MARELNIRITGDDTSAAAALNRTEAGLKRVTTETKTVDATWARLSSQQTTAASTVVKNTDAVATSTSTLKDVVIGMAEGFAASVITVQAFEMAARAAAEFIGDSIKQYLEAEQVQRKMVAALEAQGLAIPSVISQYDALSKQYENLTVNSDEAIKSAITLLAQVGGVLPTQMDAALRAVTNLSSGLDIDLKTAAIAVARGFEDGFMQLHRWIPELDTATAKAEGMDYVLGVIAKHFDGAALAEVESYAGQIKKLSNEWDDFKESVGQAAVESGSLNVLLTAAAVAIGVLTEDLKKIIGDFATIFAVASLFDPSGMAQNAVVGLAKALNDLDKAGQGVHKTFVDMDKLSDSEFFAMVRQLAEADWAKHAADRAKAAKDATDELARAAKKAAEELTRYETDYLRFMDDANLRSKAFLRSLHDGTESALVGVIRLSNGIGDLSELLHQMSTFNAPVGNGLIDGLLPYGRSVTFGPNPVDPGEQLKRTNAQADVLAHTLGLVATAFDAIGQSSDQGMRLLQRGMQSAIQIGMQFARAMAVAQNAAEVAAAASATAWAVATLGISLAIEAVVIMAQSERANAAMIAQNALETARTVRDMIAEIRSLGGDPVDPDGHPLIMFGLQLGELRERAAEVDQKIEGLGHALDLFGGHAPAALRPFINSLIESGRLTQEQADRLRAFAQGPSWQEIQKHAEELGVSIDALGQGFQQSKLNDQAKEFFARFTEFTDLPGSDPRGILAGMADEFQGLLDRSRQFGLSIPKFLEPILQQMIGFGLLKDAQGNQLTDLLQIQFNDLRSPLDEAVDWLGQIYGILFQMSGIKPGAPGTTGPTPTPPIGVGGTHPIPVSTGSATPGDITIGVYIDGRKFTEDVTVPNLPGAVRAKFGT